MKTLKVLSGIALVAMLASFAPIGGDGFTLRVNNKLVIEHYFTSKAVTPHVSLGVFSSKDAVSISYSECGTVGKNRKLALKDQAGNVLKEWKFSDTDGLNSGMVIPGSEIMAFKKTDRKTFTITYTSQVVSTGRLLAELVLENEAQVTSKK
ncbi:MAG: hypothetical protein JNM78_06065 [Cyclobacteriaceae bacterium]|nr:hypothetical protein [Cyclobacteriaceae bacterium]